MLLAAGCGVRNSADADTVVVADVDLADSLQRVARQTAAARKSDSVMATLTLEHRCARLLMPSIFATADIPTLRQLHHYACDVGVGGIILLRGDTTSVRIMTDSLRRWHRDDMFVAIDAEWGLGMRLHDAPVYPHNHELGAVASTEAMYDYGRQIASQCRRLGINMVLGPVADVVPDSVRSFLSERSLGSDPRRVGELVCAYARGLEDGGVLSVAKHFPGHGAVTADSHKSLPVIYKSLRRLTDEDLLPFRQYVQSGLSGIMIGHMAVAAVDGTLHSAAISEAVIHDMLRDDLDFTGLILTDALNMGGAGGAAPWQAVRAGADLVLSPLDTDRAAADLTHSVIAARLDIKKVDTACRRILRYLFLVNYNFPSSR